MSFTVPPVTASDATQATSGSTQAASDSESFVASTSGTAPATIDAPATGSFNVASGTAGANVAIQGDGNATINIGSANSDAGTTLDAAGTAFQVAVGYAGRVIADLSSEVVDGTNKVDLNTTATGGGTISSNLPGAGAGASIDYYLNTGSAADQVKGSGGSDFVRAGAGDDTVDGGAGDDIIRLGTGNDRATLGDGADSVYFTVDQLQQNNQTKTITDFGNGADKIQFKATDVQPGDVSIDGNVITITYSNDSGTFTTQVVAENGRTFTTDDIEFI